MQAEWDACRAVDPRNEQENLILIKIGPCEAPGLLKPFVWLDLTETDPDTAKVRQARRLAEAPAAQTRRSTPVPASFQPGKAGPATPLPGPDP